MAFRSQTLRSYLRAIRQEGIRMDNEKKTGKVELEVSTEMLGFASFYGELLGIGMKGFLEKVLEQRLEEIKNKVNDLPFTSYEILEARLAEGFQAPTQWRKK